MAARNRRARVGRNATGHRPNHSIAPTSSTAEAGTGFGLAIVGKIAAAHDWTVTICESEGGGARFEFRD